MTAKILNWDITDYSKQIREAAEFLNEHHDLSIAIPKDAPTEYHVLKLCRRHWAKLRKGGIELIKEKDYPQVRQIKSLGKDRWQCINHSKGTVYEIHRDEQDQFRCTCPANTHGSFCSHMEALFDSPAYNQPAQSVKPQSIKDALAVMSPGQAVNRAVLFPTEPPSIDTESDFIHEEELSKSTVVNQAEKSLPSPGVVQPDENEVIPLVNEVINSSPLYLPNGFVASDDQAGAFYAVRDWYSQSANPFFLVDGSAGTGKTSLLQLLVEQLPVTRIAIVAPSNKAVKVVQGKVSQVRGKVIETMTVARLLAIRPSRSSAEQVFEQDPNKEPLVSGFDLIIVDECSMQGESSFTWLSDEMQMLLSRNTRCILMGDKAQLPPVLEDTSPTFQVEDKAKLTQVIRNDGAVLEWCIFLRDHLSDNRVIKPTTNFNQDKTKGVFVLDRKDWESTLLKAFVASRDKGYNADKVRALAWTNKRVDQLNQRIRGALNPNATQYEVGDRLIVKTPFMVSQFNDDDWLQTSDELTVIREAVSGECEGIPVWQVLVETVAGVALQVPVIKMSGMGRYKQRLKEFRDAKQFSAFWNFKESFCDVSHAYALTTHNSQGSTFGDVFVDAKDILKCADRTSEGTWVRQHLLYVAASRASHRVFVTFK